MRHPPSRDTQGIWRAVSTEYWSCRTKGTYFPNRSGTGTRANLVEVCQMDVQCRYGTPTSGDHSASHSESVQRRLANI
jgi:hypothetical protein